MMKKLSTLLLLILLVVNTSCSEKQTKLLLGGSGLNKVMIIDKATQSVEWEYPLEKNWECNSVCFTPQGNILFSYRRGAMEVDENHQIVWNIQAPEGCEMQTASVLENGNYLLAYTGHPAVIMEVDKNGEILSQTNYETGVKNCHAQFRQIVKKENNYLVPVMGASEVREISKEGEVLSTIKAEGNLFTVKMIDNTMGWISCGDAHKLLKVNMATGEVLKQFKQDDIEGCKLCFVAGIKDSEKGNLYLCNWQGHSGKVNKISSLIEIDKEGKIIWQLNPDLTSLISSVDIAMR